MAASRLLDAVDAFAQRELGRQRNHLGYHHAEAAERFQSIAELGPAIYPHSQPMHPMVAAA